MRWLREVAGLFVDDGAFALAILAWLACVWLLATLAMIGPAWAGGALFAGLAAILVASVLRRPRRP